MLTIGRYTVILPEQYDKALGEAYESGHLSDVEYADDDIEAMEIVAEVMRIEPYFIIVLDEKGSNGYK